MNGQENHGAPEGASSPRAAFITRNRIVLKLAVVCGLVKHGAPRLGNTLELLMQTTLSGSAISGDH